MAMLFDLNDKYNVVNCLFDGLPYLYWKDLSGIYRGANDNQIRWLGLNDLNDFVGKDIFEILSDHDSAKRIHDVDNLIMSEGLPRVIEETIRFANGDAKAYLSYKMPLANHKQGVVGLLGFSLNITQYYQERQKMLAEHLVEVFNLKRKLWSLENSLTATMSSELAEFKEDVPVELTTINLTKRQQEVLFLLLVGKTTKQIVEIFFKVLNIKISTSTINSIIKNELFPIFQVTSLPALQQTVWQLDIFKSPPPSLCFNR